MSRDLQQRSERASREPATESSGSASASPIQFRSTGVIPPVGGAFQAKPSPTDGAYLQLKGTTDAGFDKVAKKGVKTTTAPKTIVIPDEIAAGMQDAWKGSFPGGKAKEQGGNIVRNKDGSYGWRKGGEKSNDEAFIPDPDNVGKGQKLAGVGHTHPYNSGKTDVTFGGDDIASIVDDAGQLNLVQSGETLFAISRTAEFEAMVDALDEDGLWDLRKKIADTWTAVNDKTKGTFQEKAEAATVAVCRQFKLVYYRGKGKTLNRVV